VFARIGNTWRIMGQSWGIIKAEKSLLLLPLISGLLCLVVIASFVIPLLHTTGDLTVDDGSGGAVHHDNAYYAVLFACYFACYFVIIFFNSALIASASLHMAGKPSGLGEGLGVALKRLPQILGWALVSATVGVLLKVLENQRLIGRILSSILGTVWTLLTFLAVPALVIEGCGPLGAFGTSSRLLKKTWGEQIVAGFSFEIIFILLAIPAILLLVAAGMTGTLGRSSLGVVVFGVAVLYLLALGVVQSALMTIFQTSLYLYARDGKAPEGFEAGVLSGAVART
jgi:hypothetical protein